jgi:alpha-ribazole phosphatase
MSPETTEWWLVRHAPTINPDRLVYGELDLDVTLPGPATLKALSDMLPADPVWVVSHLSRSRRTLEGILSVRGIDDAEIHEEPAFGEQRFGDWEGRRGEEVWAEIREAEKTWPADIRPPGGESFSDVAARVAAAAEDWSGRMRGRAVVAVIHAGSIRGFLAAAMGGAPPVALSYVVETLSVTRCDNLGDAGWRIGFVNRLPSLPPR